MKPDHQAQEILNKAKWRDFVLPADLNKVALQVLGIFFGSKASKKIYELKSGRGEEVRTREETVLAMIRERGKAERKEVMAQLKISDSTAGRLLDGMEKKGVITQVGQYKDAYYVAGAGKKDE